MTQKKVNKKPVKRTKPVGVITRLMGLEHNLGRLEQRIWSLENPTTSVDITDPKNFKALEDRISELEGNMIMVDVETKVKAIPAMAEQLTRNTLAVDSNSEDIGRLYERMGEMNQDIEGLIGFTKLVPGFYGVDPAKPGSERTVFSVFSYNRPEVWEAQALKIHDLEIQKIGLTEARNFLSRCLDEVKKERDAAVQALDYFKKFDSPSALSLLKISALEKELAEVRRQRNEIQGRVTNQAESIGSLLTERDELKAELETARRSYVKLCTGAAQCEENDRLKKELAGASILYHDALNGMNALREKLTVLLSRG